MRSWRSVVALAAFCVVGSASAAETIESLEKKLQAVSEKVTSIVCKQRIVVDSDMGGGNSLHKDEQGPCEYMKQAGKTLWRLEAKGRQVQKSGKNESKMDFDSVKFDDGDHSWMLLISGGKTIAYKLKMRDASIQVMADKAFFDELRKDNEVKVLPDEAIEGKACYVVESLPNMFKGKTGPGEGVTRHYIQQETGLIVKEVNNDMKAKPMTTMTRSDIKINAPINADRFAPPAGVEVVDMAKN
ncbi:MAG TPA: hypothetical protein VNT79_01040 [Phycisphaerae bacterium]|nr:hypothetical protein [Phycisphaerae bacterium]